MLPYLYVTVDVEKFRKRHPVFRDGVEAVNFLMERLKNAPLGFEKIKGLGEYVERWEVVSVPYGSNINIPLRENMDRILSEHPEYSTEIKADDGNIKFDTIFFPFIPLALYKN